MIIVYSKELTIRMKYIFSLIFKEFMGNEVVFTSDVDEFQNASWPKVNYSELDLQDCDLWVVPHGLLFEMGVKEVNIEYVLFQNVQCPFKVKSKQSDFPFDPFAAAFFLITRYEEYLPYKKDEYGRFPADQSIAYKKGFLEIPVIDVWAMEIQRLMAKSNPSLQVRLPKYSFIPTIDVDVAYAYKLRGLIRTLGGAMQSFLRFDLPSLFQRFRVCLRKEEDPYDTFDYLHELHKKYKLKPVFFVLFADYDINDKNISVLNKKFQYLIKSLGDYAEIGIHPSYNSFKMPAKMKKEIERLSRTINREITKSRQHFLRMSLPSTYNQLDDCGIKEDYTMGYARHIGFRASTARPFYFYNLEDENPASLKIFPFAVMDGTLKDYMQLSPAQSERAICSMIDKVKSVNGVFISLWHNHSLSGQGEWKGWRKVYETLLDEAENLS
ncbi:MAG: polysaccharide deacetylase family protein [Bacteroidales bacterium]